MPEIIQRAVKFEKRERWKSRPQYKGLPIPFTTVTVASHPGDEIGVPNFQAVDLERNLICCQQKLCMLCGQSLITGEDPMWLAFIGGDTCITTREFIDPPMHPECAYYAAEVCPYLKNEDGAYSKVRSQRAPEGATMIQLNEEDRVRPKKMVIYFAKGFKVELRGPVLMFIAKQNPHVIDWEAMP